jgi:1-acyl-sn-glycerol-3-phosphate acyltransferase
MIHRLLGVLFFLGITINFFWLVPSWLIICRTIPRYRYSFSTLGTWYFKWYLPLFGIRPKVIGREFHIEDQAVVIMSNHQSFIDIGVLMCTLRPLSFLAKKELFQIPLFGPALAQTGTLQVDRSNPRANRDIPQRIRSKMELGYSYGIYPEGTRSKDGTLLDFKKGIFTIIKQAPVPVLPVTLNYTGYRVPKKGFILRPGVVEVIVHPVITPQEIETMSVPEFQAKTRETILADLSPWPS